jgi:hypothetical protein
MSLKAVSGARDGNRMVDVLWEGHTYVMFAIDMTERGIDVLQTGERARKQLLSHM